MITKIRKLLLLIKITSRLQDMLVFRQLTMDQPQDMAVHQFHQLQATVALQLPQLQATVAHQLHQMQAWRCINQVLFNLRLHQEPKDTKVDPAISK